MEKIKIHVLRTGEVRVSSYLLFGGDDCIESLATHDTDVQPHVIELNNILSLQQILKQNARFFATYIGNSRAITLFEVIQIKRFAFNDKTALESVALMNAGIG